MKKLLAFLSLASCGAAFAAELKITLDADRSETDDIAIVADTDLDLAGHTINGRLWVDEGATLTISDSVGGGKVEHKGSYTLIVRGTAILNSGTLVNASASGVVCLNYSQAKPKFIMNGGEVKATSVTTEAAAIFAGACTTDNGIVEIHGGTISGLVGVSLAGQNKLTMDGGTILTTVSPAVATRNGIYVGQSDFVTVDVHNGEATIPQIGGAVTRMNSSDSLIGAKLKGGAYQKKVGSWALANGYSCKKEGSLPYLYVIKKDVTELTVKITDKEEAEQEVKVDIPQSFIDKIAEEYADENDMDVEDLEPEDWDEINATVKEELDKPGEDGMLGWQKVQLGLDVNANLAVCSIAHTSEEHSTVALHKASTIEKSEGSNVEVSYALHKGSAEGEVIKTNSEPVFEVELTHLSKEAPVETWAITAVFTATKNAAGETIEAEAKARSVNEVGAIRVENEASSVLLASPWVDIHEDSSHLDHIKVKNLVDTATLTPGDTLNVYNDNGTYSAFELSQQKTWTPITGVTAEGTTTPSVNLEVRPGQAVWLNRQDTSKPVFMLGQVEEHDVEKLTPPTGTSEAPVASILGNPNAKATVITAEMAASMGADQILVTKGEAFVRYELKDGKLGTYETNNKGKRVFAEVSPLTIPAGEAFWYQSQGGSITIPVK